jgi:hypothetical protein
VILRVGVRGNTCMELGVSKFEDNIPSSLYFCSPDGRLAADSAVLHH